MIAIVVLNYNGREDTLECLRSLFEVAPEKASIIVVDNGSTDGTIEALGMPEFRPRIDLVRLPTNTGISGGNNAGIRRALEIGADRVMLLSNDTTVEPGTVEALSEALDEEGVGVTASAIVYYSDPRTVWFAGSRFDAVLGRAPFLHTNEPADHLPARFEVDCLMGCNMMIRREVLENVGIFDDRYFFQNEDLDFSRRVRSAGWKMLVVARARVRHKIGRTIGEGSPDRWYYATRNRLLFMEERLPRRTRAIARFAYASTRLVLFAKWTLRRRKDLVHASIEGWRDHRRRRYGRRARN